MIAETRGDGIPLVAVHGFGVDHRIMLPVDEMIDTEGWRRVYIDLPCAEGATDTGAKTPKEVADAVLAEVRELAGGGPFAIIGNSFGAMVARHVAHALAPQCLGLATLAGAFELDRALRELPPREVMIHDHRILELAGAARSDFEEMAVIHTEQALRGFERYVLPGIRGAQLRVLARLNATYTDAYAPETEHHEPFTAPALHVFGRQDHVVGFADGLAAARHYPRGTFTVLDGAGHNVHIEQPEVVGALVRDWLSRAGRHKLR
ncbi:alpha/beta fold hydrolase [Leucobacter sp. NPDC015123]|uniref:alpha/beta fold hydrolase n=1 Tax=Leucobacter sp. NPDC015123 TaxID=3364129 RepID=UPI0036F483D3